jgi:hypothetical protein
MSHDTELQKKAREAIQSRRLPKLPPERMWGGPGHGGECTICGKPLRRDETEFELQFARTDDRGPDTCHVHIGCFAAWEFVREDPDSTERIYQPNSDTDVSARVLPRSVDEGIMIGCERDVTRK